MIYVCRCCKQEIPQDRPRVEILVSQERPRRGMHASGRMAASACDDCAAGVAQGIHRVASLWTPDTACAHSTESLFQ